MNPTTAKDRLIAGGVSLLGAGVVLVTMIVLNGREMKPREDLMRAAAEFQVTPDRSPPPAQAPAPPPPPSNRTPQAPPPAIASGLGGLDFGLDGLVADGLAGTESILDVEDTVVMTSTTVDELPSAVRQVPAAYPSRARARGQEGHVVLSFIVNVQGGVEDIVVVESVPAGVFDDAALSSVTQWRFSPGLYQGEQVPVRVEQTLQFELG